MAGRRVCVTGGAGFIGSHLVEALVRVGAQVWVLDDLSSGSLANLLGVQAQIRFVKGSILEEGALEDAIGPAEIVFHHAALVSVAESLEQPLRYREVNVDGTLAVLEAARRHGCARLVYAGSCSAYGDLEGLPKREEDPVHPTSLYAAMKLAGEDLVAAYASSFPMDTVRLRYFNVYGPRQSHDSSYAAVIPKFLNVLASGGEAVVFGDGEQTRDFVHVDDVVQANMLAAAHPTALDGAVFNVGSGSRRSVLEVLNLVAATLGVSASCRHEPARAGEVRDSEASIERARRELGYEPSRTFEDGLAEIEKAAT